MTKKKNVVKKEVAWIALVAIVVVMIFVARQYFSLTGYLSDLENSLLTRSGVLGSEREPNDSLMQATPIRFGQTLQGRISSAKDVDYYTFDLVTAGKVTVVLSQLPKDYDLVLYGPDLAVVARSTKTGSTDEVISGNLTNLGKYYLSVGSKSGGFSVNSPYLLKLSR